MSCHGCVSNKKRGGRPHLHVATGRQSGGSPPVQRGVAAQCGPCDALRSSIAPPSSECNHSAAEGLRRRRGVGSPHIAGRQAPATAPGRRSGCCRRCSRHRAAGAPHTTAGCLRRRVRPGPPCRASPRRAGHLTPGAGPAHTAVGAGVADTAAPQPNHGRATTAGCASRSGPASAPGAMAPAWAGVQQPAARRRALASRAAATIARSSGWMCSRGGAWRMLSRSSAGDVTGCASSARTAPS